MSSKHIYGIHAVESSLRAGSFDCLYIREGKERGRVKELVELAGQLSCDVKRLPDSAFLALIDGDKSHQGVILLVKSEFQSQANLDQLIEQRKGRRLFLLLDGVTDPGNLGACLRSAATLGVDAVIAPKNASAPLNADAVKRSSGGAARVPYFQVANLARCIDQLKSSGVWVVGTVLETDQLISQIDLTGDIALIMGSEGKGLRTNTIKHCDFLARIPMNDGNLGFNVSVATGICLYEAQRQRLAVG
jgi:23S rRNA (guanosine2251-2'-O)-methyltransferase